MQDLAGTSLGERELSYTERDAILYALAVGAREDELDLVYERDLRVLPAFALTLGLWTVEATGALGAYDPARSLHAAQRLEVRGPLRPSGTVRVSGAVTAVWDKGKGALVDVVAECADWTATYSIFLPGLGGWGGRRGPGSRGRTFQPAWEAQYPTPVNLAALYRLTGDRHPIHIDPEVSAANGFPRPILHGLCTLGIAAKSVAEAAQAHPCDLVELEARFTAPVLPGDTLDLSAGPAEHTTAFTAQVGDTTVLRDGVARFKVVSS
ncbi:MaoC/PaaZ C-terminal domain-containing protein [Prauserella flavalba]|uniref:MaoC/PaaZ C-terminal domain-containing protein n=1 Tax=Prauserella flavalba TaxID=1477506 RepID=UPI001FEA1C80|nr:MaoC/PaaZ C-terminal domain-containing protein [Prauserella flavalba]